MKKLDDGHYEVVGYQKFENGRIYHQAVDSNNWHDISLIGESNVNLVIEGLTKLPFYIEHNRLDRYTGVDLKDGTKIFENDILEYNEVGHYKVVLKNGAWCGEPTSDSYIGLATARIYTACKKGYYHKRIAISGVNDGGEG
jgi:hypothetical protein